MHVDHSKQYETTTDAITSVKGIGVAAGQSANIDNLKLVVPNSVAPSTSFKQSIVATTYMVRVSRYGLNT